MKKSVRNLVVLLVIVLAMAGVIYGLTLNPGETEEASSSAAEETREKLLNYASEDIDSIEISSPLGSYTAKAVETTGLAEGYESAADSEAETVISYTIPDLADFDLNTVAVTTAAESLYPLMASKNLGEQSELEPYGLSGDGEGKAVFRFKDGSSETLIIGGEAGSGIGTYVLCQGKVYVVNGISANLLMDPYDFLDKTVYTVASQGTMDEAGNPAEAPDLLERLYFSGSRFPEPIEVVYEPREFINYRMKTPMEADAAIDKISGLTEPLKQLGAAAVVLPGYQRADLESYGLLAPAAALTFVMNGESHEIQASEPDAEGNCYVIADDKENIYQLPWSDLAPWAELSLMDLRSNYIRLPNINEVQSLALITPETRLDLEISRTTEETESKPEQEAASAEAEKPKNYILTIHCQGKEVAYEEVYQPFYQDLISMTILSADALPYDGENPVLEVLYSYFDGGTTSLAFYPVEDLDRYAVEVDGAFNGILRQSTVEELIAQMEGVRENRPAEA